MEKSDRQREEACKGAETEGASELMTSYGETVKRAKAGSSNQNV